MGGTIVNPKPSNLKRQRIAMPDLVKQALDGKNLMQVYFDRPAYQQNDTLAWIMRAKRPETVRKRLNQMLAELEQGGVYMNMKHQQSTRK
jgi:uncharacterized protein YdeI (YjbR/CyaY-like superfamily)